MIVVGINISHDASSCVVEDGKVIYFCEEERLAKIKHYVLDIESKFYGISKLKKYGIKKIDSLVFVSFRRENDIADLHIINNIKDQIEQAGIKINSVVYNPELHHLYHACNAFYASGFEESAALIADGSGAYTNKFIEYREIESIYKFNSTAISMMYQHCTDNNYMTDTNIKYNKILFPYELLLSNGVSCGKLFTHWCTNVNLGAEEDAGNNAGKYMGLASYGKLDDNSDWIDYIDDSPIFNSACIDKIKQYNLSRTSLVKGTKEFQILANIAKKVQEETKKYTIQLIKKALKKADSNNIVLSGGYFLNCVNNYEYIKAFPDVNFYIDPIALDSGTSMGAALLQYKKIIGVKSTIEPIKNLYLGG
jgi:carbamoyltransferase